MNRIVVGVDGSPAAMAGARWAAREAAMRAIELIVVHVVHTDLAGWPQPAWPVIPVPTALGEDRLRHGERILEDALAVIAKTTGPCQPRSITGRLCVGAIVPTLRDFCRETAQMVVIGRRGRGGIHRGLVGSVSSAILNTSNCPVAVIHDESTVEYPNAPLVLGVDGSAVSECATAIAFDEASRRGIDLVAVHATDHPDDSQAEQLPARWLAEHQLRNPDVVVSRVVIDAHPADALLAQSHHAQLVVVGSRGRGVVKGKLLGSVSAAVVQASRIPVIVAGRRACLPLTAPTPDAHEPWPTAANADFSSDASTTQSSRGSTGLGRKKQAS